MPQFLTMDDLNKRLQYKKEKKIKLNGQLKLLLSTMNFLLDVAKDNDTVLYIGSGKGYNIPTLMTAFKDYNLKWHLYDPVGHCDALENREGVYNKIFNIKEAKQFENVENLLFISDIRTVMGDTVTSRDLLNDYTLQNQLLEVLNPRAALLKWRCPFPDDWVGNVKIPEGKEYLQPFNALYSSELRLFCSTPYVFKTITIDDSKRYEELLYYYNKVIRQKYDNDNVIWEYIFNKMSTNVRKNLNVINKTSLEVLEIFKQNIESEKPKANLKGLKRQIESEKQPIDIILKALKRQVEIEKVSKKNFKNIYK